MTKLTLDQKRAVYVPVDAKIVRDENSTAVAYLYTGTNGKAEGKPCIRAFSGRKQKPTVNCYYETVEARDNAMSKFFDIVSTREANRKERKACETAADSGIKVGTILYSSWGYDQTNIDFYEVTEISDSGKSIKIAELAQDREYTRVDSGTCAPVKGCFAGEESGFKRIQNYGRPSVKINECASAWIWEGRTMHWSSDR